MEGGGGGMGAVFKILSYTDGNQIKEQLSEK